MKYLSLAFLILVCACSPKNDDHIQQALLDLYPDATDLEFGVDDNGYTEVKFNSKDRDLRADFSEAGEWIETEESIDYNDLPETVLNAISKDFDKEDIAEIEWVEHNSKGIFYDIELKQPGKNLDIEINESGNRIN